MYLKIQNAGEAPVEGFTLLGVSTSRACGTEGVIGQFGSGNKHAINVLLRAGLKLVVFCGKTRLVFETRESMIDDGLTQTPVHRVVCRVGNTKPIDLGWVLDFGAIDWVDTSMALREFISNAIDRTLRQGDDVLAAIRTGDLGVVPVADTQVRARSGYTRVFVEMDADVQRFYGELPERFLHFSDKPDVLGQRLIVKPELSRAKVYREGVFVREVSGAPSLFDYNFSSSQLSIDECRNSSDYSVRASAARLIRNATTSELVVILRAIVDRTECFESNLESSYLLPSWERPTDHQRTQWQQAWEVVTGGAVACPSVGSVPSSVQKKGYEVVSVESLTHVDMLGRFGVKTHMEVLSQPEQDGLELLPPDAYAKKAVDIVWDWLSDLSLTNNRPKPRVGCFHSIVNAGSQRLGFADQSGVYLSTSITDTLSRELLQTALEEVVHWVTGSQDCSRDIQEFLFRMIIGIQTSNQLSAI